MTGTLGGRSTIASVAGPLIALPPMDSGAVGSPPEPCITYAFDESFNKANGALGPDLTWWNGASQPGVIIAVVASNAAGVPSGQGGAVALCHTDMVRADKSLEAVVGAWTLPNAFMQTELRLCARWDLGTNPAGGSIIGNEFLRVTSTSAGVTTWRLHNFYEDSGNPSGLVSATGTTPAPGDTVTFSAIGTELVASLNGVQQVAWSLSPGNEVSIGGELVAMNMILGNDQSGSVTVNAMHVDTVCP